MNINLPFSGDFLCGKSTEYIKRLIEITLPKVLKFNFVFLQLEFSHLTAYSSWPVVYSVYNFNQKTGNIHYNKV